MGGVRIDEQEQDTIRRLATVFYVEEIAAELHHSKSTIYAIIRGDYVAEAPKANRTRLLKPHRWPDSPVPTISEATQRAVDKAAGETSRGPGRYERIAQAAGVTLAVVYLLLRGQCPPGTEIKIVGNRGRKNWYAEV